MRGYELSDFEWGVIAPLPLQGHQRNIISERVLKMPRERTGDTDKQFKDVPRNIVA